MKRVLISAVALALCLGIAYGQDQVSTDAQVSVLVIRAISIDVERGLDFGTLVAGTATDVTIPSNDFNNAARFDISAVAGYNVSLEIDAPTELVIDGTADAIGFAVDVPQYSANVNGDGAQALASANGGVIENVADPVHLWVGGTISLTGADATGEYGGTITVTASYDNL